MKSPNDWSRSPECGSGLLTLPTTPLPAALTRFINYFTIFMSFFIALSILQRALPYKLLLISGMRLDERSST
jgi:hypothetical protein